MFAGLFDGGIDRAVATGDWFVLASAAAWALHVVLIGVMAPKRDPTALVGVQFAVAALLSGVMVLVFERGTAALSAASWQDAWRASALAVAYSGLFATAVAFTLQFIAQRHAPPTHATVLMSTEAIFAAVFGWILLSEILGIWEWIGGGLMLAGAIVSQLMGPGPAPEVSGTGADPTPPP
jgi:drug/metabolite transporter (DMT)-like permease